MTRHNADANSDRAKLNKPECSVHLEIFASQYKSGAAEFIQDFLFNRNLRNFELVECNQPKNQTKPITKKKKKKAKTIQLNYKANRLHRYVWKKLWLIKYGSQHEVFALGQNEFLFLSKEIE